VGLAAQLPSGTTEDLDYYSTFWDFLVRGGQAYEPLDNILGSPQFPANRARPQVQLPATGAFLKNATSCDFLAFGISARDARVAPFSTRRLMDLSFRALADSGIESRGQKIGCFMSGALGIDGKGDVDTEGSFSYMAHAMPNRISYALDLRGPSIHVDTACSSSLTALHLAIGAIERGDCTVALVEAAQVN
ncbi:beta-ketoacyl synthase, partial [Mycena rebaudengoi]